MSLHHGGAPAEEEPMHGIPSWEEMWWRAYNVLGARHARGWQPADWEEMAQEAVLKAIKAIAFGRVDERQFDAWFDRVVQNVAIDRQRARSGRQGEREVLPIASVDALEDERAAAQLNSVLAQLDVQASLADPTLLRPHEREVIELMFWYGLSSNEVAEVLGVDSASTIRTWRRNALRKLREHSGEA